MKPSNNSAQREWTAVAILTLLGAGLRLWSFGSLGLTHFDEGIYALSGLWSLSPGGIQGLDSLVIPYAPAGFPILVGLAYLFLGAADVSAILVSAMFGIATIPMAAWISRRTFGPGAGAAAATFFCFSVMNIAFSRKALTDVPLTFFWLAAIGAGCRFLERPGLGRALVFGICVGLAQNIKYNGWLVGVIVILVALAGLVISPLARRKEMLWRVWGFGAVAVLVAALLYWPWFDFVERHGGYSALLRHHRSYLGSAGSWWPHWKQQMAQVIALSGGTSWQIFTWTLAWVACTWAVTGFTKNDVASRRWWGGWIGGLLLGAAALLGLGEVSWWVGLIFVPWLVVDERPASRCLAIWWLVLSVMTPFYHPYARLWLPLEACGLILMAGAAVSLGTFARDPRVLQGTWFTRGPIPWGSLVLVLGLAIQPKAAPFSLRKVFQETNRIRDGITRLTSGADSSLPPGSELRILGRGPLSYYLVLQNRYPFRIVADSKSLFSSANQGNWALLDSVQLEQELGSGSLASFLKDKVGAASRVWSGPLDPVTLLDAQPSAAMGIERERKSEGWLLRIDSGLSLP